MMTRQYPASAPANRRGVRTQQFVTSRIIGSLLVGIVITLVLTCIELAIIWFFNPANMLGSAHSRDISALVAFLKIMPWLLLAPLIEFGVISLAAYLAARPLAVLAYIRTIQKEQSEFRNKNTKLDSLAHIYKMPVTFYEHNPDPQVLKQGRNLTLLELVEQSQDASLLIEGAAGTGKTKALQQYRYFAAQQRRALLRGKNKIPVYIPLKNYSLYLKSVSQAHIPAAGENGVDNKNQEAISDELIQQATLFDFILDSELESVHALRPYLKKLSDQGRLLFLCDGLDEIDYHYRAAVCGELAEMLRVGNVARNRFVITCREAEYKKVPELEQLVNEGHIERAVISPLQTDLVREFVEQYIEAQGDQWQHTAGQIMQVIQSNRLRYLCTNPLMLFSFLEIIDKVGIERGRKLDTRGHILREYVSQLIQREQKRPEWKKSVPAENDVIMLLSRIAFLTRWSNDGENIQLPVAKGKMGVGKQAERCAGELLNWLKEHPADEVIGTVEPYDHSDLTQLLQFAQSATLIEISQEGILSFRHQLMADYFVAQYFLVIFSDEMKIPSQQEEHLSILVRDFLSNAAYWSEPVALWAGMVDMPMQLAEQFAKFGNSQDSDSLNSEGGQSNYSVEALALGLLCVGVSWMPPQEQVRQASALSPRLTTLMAGVLRDNAARQELAQVFTQCAEEGASEIYRSLMFLIMLDGIEEFFVQLDTAIVPKLLFTYLYDTVDLLEYEAQVKHLCRVLSYFGQIAVLHAGELSRPVPGRSIRLRAAAINILGTTQQSSAVEPLIVRLSDREQFIIERSINALIRLGPELSLPRVFQELDNRTPALAIRKAHSAALAVLEFFLNEQDAQQLTPPQYMRVMESLVSVLSSNYAIEQEIQQQAREMLVRLIKRQETQTTQNRPIAKTTSPVRTQERGLPVVMRYLSSGDEILAGNMLRVLQEVGPIATPALLEQLQKEPTEIVRSRIIEVLKKIHDPRALPTILRLVADPSPLVLQQVTSTLHSFQSESVPGLIDLVLAGTDEVVAERAAHMLKGMGTEIVAPVTQALLPIVHERTRLLVQILEQIKDERAIPALLSLVDPSQNEPLLAIAVIHALSQYSTKQVVSPLLKMLEN
ncbi:MAG TPA: HEAT repeat domain-containing protein, partial [Ktedonobacteraceae bacterium]|nr:HEAT repeat domain-containing protein [Ktedonobacteraceae bacterium]